MKNFTFKFTVLILFAMVFQAQAQLESGSSYTFRNVGTGKYLSTGGGNGWLYAPADDIDETSYTTAFIVTSAGDGLFSIEGSRPGLMVLRDNGVIGQSTTRASAASIPADRQLTLEKVTGTDFYVIHRSSKYVRENTPEEVTAETYPSIISGADPDTADQRQMWFLEAATLSTIEIAKSSVFMSNPVKDNISISGLTEEINQIQVYSLLGTKVISQKVNNLSSLQINVSGLSKGMYIVSFVGENGNFTKKLIKQ
jgi:hypothetical protein